MSGASWTEPLAAYPTHTLAESKAFRPRAHRLASLCVYQPAFGADPVFRAAVLEVLNLTEPQLAAWLHWNAPK